MTAKPAVSRKPLLVLGLLTLTLGGGALAWACTPNAGVAVTSAGGSSFAYPGGQAALAVSGYVSGAAVTVHWNGEAGPVIARGVGPSFQATVTIPAVADGVYMVVSRGQDQNGTERLGRAAVRVGEPGTGLPPDASDGGASGATGSVTTGAGEPARSTAPGTTSGSTTGGDAARRTQRSANVGGAERAPAQVGAGEGTGTTGQRRGAASTGAAGAGPGATDAGVATLGSGRQVFADSVGSGAAEGSAASGRSGATSAGTTPSKRSADGDLWSGFSSDAPVSAGGLDAAAGPASGPGSGLAPALALAGFGLVALLGGVGAATARRRRAVARGTASDPRD